MSDTKHVAETGTKFRKPGEHAARPFIAADVLRTAACITTAVELSNLPLEAATTAVCETLSDLQTSTTRIAVVRTLSRASNVPSSDLYTTWDLAVADQTATGSVKAVIAELTLQGVAAERISWAVISAETLRHHKLVLREANRMATMWADWSADDLVGFGWRGLRLALRSYDPNQALLSTFCVPRIRGSIKDGVRAEGHLPKRLLTLRNKVNEAERMLTETLDRRPSLEELAVAVEVDLDRIRLMPRLAAPTSMDSLLSVDDAPREFASEDAPAEDLFEAAERSTAIAEALTSLDAEAAEAVQLLVMDGKSFSQAQRVTGVSARQLRARRDRGLAVLADSLSAWAA